MPYYRSALLHPSDDTKFRNLVIWLEDTKIRHYKIDERKNLRNLELPEWKKYFKTVLKHFKIISALKSSNRKIFSIYQI